MDELMAAGSGDVLVFCAGQRDIRDADDALAKHLGSRYVKPGETRSGVEVLPLYARLSTAEQQRVFQPGSNRRVVLATNVAETSLTVPGIRYVVDPGTARISRYSNRTKVQRLPIEPISQASANQRAGRSGRVAPGIAIRLYEQQDFESRPEFTEPEVLRTSLASVILQMTALGLGDIAQFPFIDPPDSRAIRDGVNLLRELGAVDSSGRRLTRVGRDLARLPIDPRLGRMLIEARRLGCVRDVMIIVAALSIQDVRERPAAHQQAADESHARFADERSDFMALLNLWDYVQTQQKEMSRSAFRRMAKREFLHYLRIREWQDVFTQLRHMASSVGLRVNRSHKRADYDLIHQAILSGLLSHIGSWSERTRDYHGTRGARFVIFPGSFVAKRKHEWIMAAELVETSRLFARSVAQIEPEWIEPLAAHLIKKSFSEPYWSTRSVRAMARERVTLLGVSIVVDRPIPLARVDEEMAREMFIRHALVEAQWQTHHEFLDRNEGLREQARDLTARARRPDLLVDDEDLVDFYLERIPAHVTSGAHFDSWWKTVENPALLDFSLDLLVPGRRTIDTSAFPEQWI
ncbi:MAG TPA: ATP-dependent RNA helicase HrpA, partial [Beutenbergiaceae bacterium]|nr:ATP-dependent RNA helicase HrpA [Beutenbergiaceae bacterium]